MRDAQMGSNGLLSRGHAALGCDLLFRVLLFILPACIVSNAWAQCPAPLGSYDTPGWAYSVTVEGTTAYVADYSAGLQILDVSDPASPVLLATDTYSYWARDVVVAGGIAYVAAENGLKIVDVSDPSAPVLLGSHATADDARGICVVDGLVYVAEEEAGLEIFDVSDPTAPILLGVYDSPWNAVDVEVLDGIAYVVSLLYGLEIVDVSDPGSPQLLGQYTIGHTERTPDVAVLGTTAILAHDRHGVLLLDVSDPTAPVVLSEIDPWSSSVVGVAVQGPHLYVSMHSLFGILDVSDPAHPAPLGVLGIPPSGQRMCVSGSTAYIATAGAGMSTFEVSDCEYCPADFNRDGVFDSRDFLAYLNAWNTGDPRADWDQDGDADTADFLAFLNDWTSECD